MVVLTIDTNDPSQEKVKKWMTDRGYHFPVLWGDQFAFRAGVTAFPTTWVVDQEGGIAFEVVGSTSHFTQEFGWRVEALLEDGGES